MLASTFLMMAIAWVLLRFHVVEAASRTITLVKILIILPIAIGSVLALLAVIRNATNGFVVGRDGGFWGELYATERPIVFTYNLIGQLFLWAALTYISFKAFAYLAH